jgi:hypothetical protein
MQNIFEKEHRILFVIDYFIWGIFVKGSTFLFYEYILDYFMWVIFCKNSTFLC